MLFLFMQLIILPAVDHADENGTRYRDGRLVSSVKHFTMTIWFGMPNCSTTQSLTSSSYLTRLSARYVTKVLFFYCCTVQYNFILKVMSCVMTPPHDSQKCGYYFYENSTLCRNVLQPSTTP